MDSIIELKKDIENNKDIQIILIKSLNITSKLGLKEYEKWITCELQGYDNPKELPNYRIIACEVLYNIIEKSVHGATFNPLEVGLPPKFNEVFNKMFLKKPINLIKEYYKNQEDPIQFKVPDEVNKTINQFSKINVEIYRQFPLAELKNIISQVKNNIYLMCLELEKNNILDESQSREHTTENRININFNTIIFNIDTINQNIIEKYNEITTNITNIDMDESIKIDILNNMNIMKDEISKENPDIIVLENTGTKLNELATGISSSIIAQGIINFVMFIFQIWQISPT